MELAETEARRLKNEYVGTAHILLGLINEENGVAVRILEIMHIDAHKIRQEVEKLTRIGADSPPVGRLQLTPRAKNVLNYAREEMLKLNLNYISTDDLLFGLIREEEGVAGHVLKLNGLKYEEVRREM